MTKERVEYWTRLGIKSQIVLKKEARELMRLQPGSLVRVLATPEKTELKPITKEQMIADVKKIARLAGKHWPKGKTSVDLVREQRR